MPANVEIKARVPHPLELLQRARELADGPATVLHQKDTFFATRNGRLKLREFADGTGELIGYFRPDRSGPKISDYAIYPAQDPAVLARILAGNLGVIGVVEKTRTLLLVGRTRIHLDEVRDLGSFMELEVVLAPGEDPADGETEAHQLMAKLGIGRDDLVVGAYLDLLQAARPTDKSGSGPGPG